MTLIVDIQKRLPHYTLNAAFTVEREPLGIIGSSGSGKSMTLRCIAGIETPTKGTIVLGDRILFDSRKGINLPTRDRLVGFLFQNYALFPHLSVAENIAYGLKGLSKIAQSRQVSTQLEKVQLLGFEQRYPHQLSGGQQQRVALARALATNPELLLLDEPFSALDPHLRSELEKQLIKTLSDYHGLTLFVTHNLEEAYRICQKLLVLSAGKIVGYGEKQSIFTRPGTLTVAQLTGCKNISPIQKITSYALKALDWNCTLTTSEPVSDTAAYVGIRAHQLTFSNNTNRENTFPCWLAWTSETPHRMTIFIKLNTPPKNSEDYHLQAEVFKEKWKQLEHRQFPWFVCLDSWKLLLLNH
ncbi:sulfate/molybdate ABC transporter ATP-binding protein [Coleofasciculus sp.]|uniref:sulfate/molybdate ABC transporter ATP-binding protein n=1 Tax=Coleofasciculus sp. TaxID=3100458 RepID=UPI003A3CB63A